MTKKKIRNIIAGLIALILVPAMFYYVLTSDGGDRCQWQKDFDKSRYYGVITEKFYDHTQHSVPLVILKNIGKGGIDTIDFLGDSSSIFDSLKRSDTVYKNVNTSTVFVRLNGRLKKVGDVAFGCKVNPNH